MKRLCIALLGVSLPALLAGCVDAPSTVPLATQVAPQTLGLDTAAAPQVQQDWWKAFNDPQLDRLTAQMLVGNPSLQRAMARIRAAQSEVSVQRAQDYPQVTLDPVLNRELISNAYGYLPPYGGSVRWVDDVQAHLSWSLDFWGKQAALIEKARGTALATALDADAARQALAGTFAQTYIGLALAWQNIDIADQTVAERQTILDLTQSRDEAGLENDAALEQAKALLAMAKIDVMRAQMQRDMAVHAIAALTGQGASAYADIVRPTAAADAALPLPAALPADLLSRRPDILAAQARVEASIQGRTAAHADFYPNISLTAALGFQAIGMSSLFTGDALTYGVGPAIHLPIFDAGRIRAQYAHATADLDFAVADYNDTVLAAIRQSADALTQVKSLADQRAQQQAALDSAAHAFELAKERYRLGLSGQVPLLTAEATLLQGRQQMAALVAQAAAQRVTLLLAVGGGFNPPAQQASNTP